jgi:hypothetical protein
MESQKTQASKESLPGAPGKSPTSPKEGGMGHPRPPRINTDRHGSFQGKNKNNRGLREFVREF